MARFFGFVSWLFDRWRAWVPAVLVYQVMIVVFRAAGKLSWPWWAVFLPTELGAVLLVYGVAIAYLILRNH